MYKLTCAKVNKSFYQVFLQKLEPWAQGDTKGVLSLIDNKYTITHAARIATVQNGVVRIT